MDENKPIETTRAGYLVEKIRIIENRRNYFGNIFWRMPGITVAIVVLFIGIAHEGKRGIEWWAFLLVGLAMLMLGQIAWRIKECQDECEHDLALLERKLSEVAGFLVDYPLRESRKYGARFRIVLVFWLAGFVSVAVGLVWWRLQA